MKLSVGLRWEKNRLLNAGNAGCGSLGILVGQCAWLTNNTVWVQRSQTWPAEIAVSCLFTCRPVGCVNDFAPTLGQKQRVLYFGFAIVGLKLGYLTPFLAGIGRLLNINNTFTTRIVGVVVLSRWSAFVAQTFCDSAARAAHEGGCRFCEWCDSMFRFATNRARHEELCLDRFEADVVAE